MENTEFVYLLKEIILLKQSIAANENGVFWKSVISITPAVIASVGTYVITKNMFDRTYKKERDFKIENEAKVLAIKAENKEKELADIHREIYSNVYYLDNEIYSQLNMSYLYAIDSEFYYYASKLEEVESEKEKEYKRKSDNLYEKHLNTMEKAITSLGKFNKSVAEYYLLFPNSNIMTFADNIAEAGIKFKPKKEFDLNMNFQQLEELQEIQSDELLKYITDEIILNFGLMIDMIKLKK